MSVPVLFYGADDVSSALALCMIGSVPDMCLLCGAANNAPHLLSGTGDPLPAGFAEALSAHDSCDLFINGPLSSAAALVLLYPQLKPRIRRIVFAGGCFRGGNASVCAERNVFADPEAVDVILRSGIPVVMIPLECGNAVYLTDEEVTVLSESCGISADLSGKIRESGPIPFRTLAAAGFCLCESLFETRELYAETELSGEYCRGSLIPDWRNQYGKPCNITAVLKADRSGVLRLLIHALQKTGKEAE